MKRQKIFEWNTDGRLARFSGVLMGIAIFAQALDYLGLHPIGSVSFYQLLTMLILPLMVETVWCVCLQLIRLKRADVYGVLGAVCCLVLLMQSFFLDSVMLTVLFCVLLLVSGAAMVLVSWGFLPWCYLGALVLFLVSATRIATAVLTHYLGGHDWLGLLRDLPSVCVLLALCSFLGSLKPTERI